MSSAARFWTSTPQAKPEHFPGCLIYRTFGYRRIKVLRPLRMTLELDKVGMERLEAEAAWEKLSDAHQTFWREAL